jgi:hypothetical protein
VFFQTPITHTDFGSHFGHRACFKPLENFFKRRPVHNPFRKFVTAHLFTDGIWHNTKLLSESLKLVSDWL